MRVNESVKFVTENLRPSVRPGCRREDSRVWFIVFLVVRFSCAIIGNHSGPLVSATS
jgi:hypothetical protein